MLKKASVKHMSYMDAYKRHIASALMEIDLLIKTSDGLIPEDAAAHALYLGEDEVRNIMRKKNIGEITKDGFFAILKDGSSAICKHIRREMECGSPDVYTRENVSYIYDIDIDMVNSVCDKLHIHEITTPELYRILNAVQIPYRVDFIQYR